MINWGIIGTGKVAHEVGFAIQSIAACQIVSVSSRKIQNAEKFANRLNIKTYFDNSSKLMAIEAVDILYISTPNSSHAELIELGLKNGKHILCEKPMTIKWDKLKALKELAVQKKLFLMEAMWTMFLPSVRQFLEESRKIGKIQLIQGSMGFVLSKDRCFHKKLGGGSILDLGVYLISLTSALLGEPLQVLNQEFSQRGDVETSAAISLKYDSAIAQLLCSFDVLLENTFTVYGEKGSVKLEAPFFRSAILSMQQYGASQEDVNAIKNPFESFLLKNGPSWKQRIFNKLNLGKQQKVVPFEGSGYQYQILEVVKCLEEKRLESSILPLDHSIQVLKIIDKLRINQNEN